MQDEDTDLKDGVHDACERPVVRVLGHFEDIQTPFVDVLQVLLESRADDCKCPSQSHNFQVFFSAE